MASSYNEIISVKDLEVNKNNGDKATGPGHNRNSVELADVAHNGQGGQGVGVS